VRIGKLDQANYLATVAKLALTPNIKPGCKDNMPSYWPSPHCVAYNEVRRLAVWHWGIVGPIASGATVTKVRTELKSLNCAACIFAEKQILRPRADGTKLKQTPSAVANLPKLCVALASCTSYIDDSY